MSMPMRVGWGLLSTASLMSCSTFFSTISKVRMVGLPSSPRTCPVCWSQTGQLVAWGVRVGRAEPVEVQQEHLGATLEEGGLARVGHPDEERLDRQRTVVDAATDPAEPCPLARHRLSLCQLLFGHGLILLG